MARSRSGDPGAHRLPQHAGALSAFQGELKTAPERQGRAVCDCAVPTFSDHLSHDLELIASVQAVVGSPDSDLLEHAESAVEVCEHFRETAAALPTAYSTSMLVSSPTSYLHLSEFSSEKRASQIRLRSTLPFPRSITHSTMSGATSFCALTSPTLARVGQRRRRLDRTRPGCCVSRDSPVSRPTASEL